MRRGLVPINQIITVGTSRGKVLSGAETASCCIRNLGANVVYLDSMTDVTANSFPLFPGDVAQWKQGKACYCLSPSGNQVLAVSDSLDNTLGLGKVTATLDPATSVGITGVDTSSGSIPVVGAVDVSNTVNVGITGTANTVSLVTGTNVGITGTPSVSVSGTPNVAVTNSPTVGISGTANTVGLSSGTNVGISGTPNVGLASNVPNTQTSATLNGALVTSAWIPVSGRSGAGFSIRGDTNTLVGTIDVIGTFDNAVATNFNIPMTDPGTSQLQTTVASAVGTWIAKTIVIPPGCTHIAVRCAAYTSGSGTVAISVTDSSGGSGTVLNTPGVVGAKVSQTVLSGATANVVSVATNSSTTVLTTTVIPSSSTQSIELHNCVFTTTGAGNTGPNTGKLIRSDTGANLAIPQSVPVAGTVSQAKDFQGALLPPGVSVQSVATTPAFGSSSTVSVDINYNLVG